MKFSRHGKRQSPTIIIVALIDILIVLLIFMLVTTTFRQQPAVKLALPESKQSKGGASETAPTIVTVDKREPYFYIGQTPVTLDTLKDTLRKEALENPDLAIAIRADTDAPFGKIINVMDAVKDAGIKNVSAHTSSPKANGG